MRHRVYAIYLLGPYYTLYNDAVLQDDNSFSTTSDGKEKKKNLENSNASYSLSFRDGD